MKFRYLGKNEDMTAFGYDFSDGQTPDVEDPKSIKKLSNNTHFEAITEEEKGMKVAELLPLIAAALTTEELDKIAEGEVRATVLHAIEKQRAKIQAPL